MSDVVLPQHFDGFGVFALVVLVRLMVGAIKRFGLAGLLQALSQLPRLENRLDLGNEGRNLSPKVGIRFSGFDRLENIDQARNPDNLLASLAV